MARAAAWAPRGQVQVDSSGGYRVPDLVRASGPDLLAQIVRSGD